MPQQVTPQHDPVMARYRAALTELYGDRLDKAVLFGSRARGDGRDDSDYDVAIFLRSMPDRWQEFDRLSYIHCDIADATGAIIHALPFEQERYFDELSLMQAIRNEGVVL